MVDKDTRKRLQKNINAGTHIERYIVVNPPEHDGNAIGVTLSDKGATSLVYLVKQILHGDSNILRVLKLFCPVMKIIERNERAGDSPGVVNFLQEIENIAQLTHQCLVKIVDSGTFEDVQYFVMEYISAPTLADILNVNTPAHRDAASRIKKDPTVIGRIARQICSAISYMHDNQFCHLDIAPKNIFVRDITAYFHVVVGDLGVARSFKNSDEDDSDILVAGTKLYCPPDLISFLNSSVKKNWIKENGPRWDLYSIIKTINEMISAFHVADSDFIKSLTIVMDGYLSGDHGCDVREFSAEIERLMPTHVITAGVEEISSDAAGHLQHMNIPIYRVPVTKRVRKILQHSGFTRLQIVPQMFLVRSSFPGGVHSMYEHAVGTYGLMQKILNKLISMPHFRADFRKEDIELALVSSLISRIGCFTFDRILKECAPLDDTELITESLDEKPEQSVKDQNISLRELFSKQFPKVDIEAAIAIVSARESDRNKLDHNGRVINSIIRSSIDIRVLDYLARDSHHTGIPIASGVDVANIINNLSYIREMGRIGVNNRAVFDLENLFCVRYWMFSRIYWSAQSRSISAMLRYVVGKIVDGDPAKARTLARRIKGCDESSALGKLADEWRVSVDASVRHASILELLQQVSPRMYVSIIELFEKNWPNRMSKATATLKNASDLDDLGEEFYRYAGSKLEIDPSQVIFDLPLERSHKLGEDIYIEVSPDKAGIGKTIKTAAEASEIIGVLPTAFNASAVRLRVFVHPYIEMDKRREIEDSCMEFLNEKFK